MIIIESLPRGNREPTESQPSAYREAIVKAIEKAT
jgi:hypothetical protein